MLPSFAPKLILALAGFLAFAVGIVEGSRGALAQCTAACPANSREVGCRTSGPDFVKVCDCLPGYQKNGDQCMATTASRGAAERQAQPRKVAPRVAQKVAPRVPQKVARKPAPAPRANPMERRQGYELEGRSYAQIDAMGLAECERHCSADKRCVAAEFYHSNKTCGLFNSLPDLKSARTIDTSIKKKLVGWGEAR